MDSELKEAVNILKREYERALKNPAVRTPIAYALYRTWRQVDTAQKKGAEKHEKAISGAGVPADD